MSFREQLSFIADLLGVITSLMAIVGISGFLTWGKLIGFKDERLKVIYGYLAVIWRVWLVLPLIFAFFFVGDKLNLWVYYMTMDTFRTLLFDYTIKNLNLMSNIAYLTGLIVAVPVFLPIAILSSHCLIVGNLEPARHFISQLYKPTSKDQK